MSVAKPLPHDSAPLHVTGRARYVDDVPLPFGLALAARQAQHAALLPDELRIGGEFLQAAQGAAPIEVPK